MRGCLQISGWRNIHPRLSLYWLNQECARVRRNRLFQSLRVAEGNRLEPRRKRPETVAVVFVARESDDRRGATVEIVGADDDLRLAIGDALHLVSPFTSGLDGSLY